MIDERLYVEQRQLRPEELASPLPLVLRREDESRLRIPRDRPLWLFAFLLLLAAAIAALVFTPGGCT